MEPLVLEYLLNFSFSPSVTVSQDWYWTHNVTMLQWILAFQPMLQLFLPQPAFWSN